MSGNEHVMKNKNDPAFVVDAGKILAQFHLGGCAIDKDAFFFNAGIVDMDGGATPDNPGKTSFNTQNSSGVYEFAYMPKTLNVDIGLTYEQFDADLQKKIESAGIADDQKTIDKLKKAELKRVNEEIDEKIQSYEDGVALDAAFDVIQKYFANFAGDANAKAMQKSGVVVCYLPNQYFKGPASVKSYKKFQIEVIGPKDKEKLAKQRFEAWQAAGSEKSIPLVGLAFKVGYRMEVETM